MKVKLLKKLRKKALKAIKVREVFGVIGIYESIGLYGSIQKHPINYPGEKPRIMYRNFDEIERDLPVHRKDYILREVRSLILKREAKRRGLNKW